MSATVTLMTKFTWKVISSYVIGLKKKFIKKKLITYHLFKIKLHYI